MKCVKQEAWRWFEEVDAMSWAVSAYIAARRAMVEGELPVRSDFGERFAAEMQARVYLAAHRKGFLCDIETPWNLPLLASFADPTFSAAELNNLPGDLDCPDTVQNRGCRGG